MSILRNGIERFYMGEDTGKVTVREEDSVRRPLDQRLDLRKLSDVGFAWGSVDAGAQQLALALLCDALHDDEQSIQLADQFTQRVIAILPARWTITRSRILQHVRVMEIQSRMQSPFSAFHADLSTMPKMG